MELIDTHCHLTTICKGLDQTHLTSVIDNACQNHVTKMICIGAGDGLESTHQAVEISNRFSNVWASIGIHPHDASQDFQFELLQDLIKNPKVVAIGETGLDFYRNLAPKDKQVDLFKNTIEFAKQYKKPLIIHCREAQEETFDLLIRHNAKEVGGVFHCYAGDVEFARELKKMNFLVSFPGSITFKNAHKLREIAQQIPLDQIMVETDSPYMAPEPFRGGPSEPKHVYQIALKLAEIKGITLEEVAKQTTANAVKLFGIDNL